MAVAVVAADVVSVLLPLMATAVLLLATRRDRTVPGDCASPWHCTGTAVLYTPLTAVLAHGMAVVLVWRVRALVSWWRQQQVAEAQTRDAWVGALVSVLVAVAGLLVGGLFLMAVA